MTAEHLAPVIDLAAARLRRLRRDAVGLWGVPADDVAGLDARSVQLLIDAAADRIMRETA